MNSDNIIYIGLKLDDESRNRLIELSESLFDEDQIHKVYCDHLTLAYGQEVEDFDESLIGKEVSLISNHVAYDENIAALVIEPSDVQELGVHNPHPHVTMVSFDDFTKPVYSNEMIASSDHEDEFVEVVELNGTVTAVRRRKM